MAADPKYLKLFVSGIPTTCSREEFLSLISPFAQNGGITELKFFERVVSDSCYAFIEFGHPADGQACCQALQQMPIHGVYIRAGAATKTHQSTSETNLYVEGVPPSWKDADLANFFQKFGKLSAARILVDKTTNLSREVGFVHFEGKDDAKKAMETCQGQPPFEGAPRAFSLKFANKGRKEREEEEMANGTWRGGGRGRGGFRGRGRGGRGRGRGRGGVANVPCRFFQQGTCAKGNACPFSHGDSGFGYNGFEQQNFFQGYGGFNGGFQDQWGGNQYNPVMAGGGYGPIRGGPGGGQWGPY